jgi:predicted house-cleaning noncanonical NTP pyrophosphatase (MazG superfamily)
MADELFDDLLDDLPEWTNLRELLSAIEEQMGRKVRDEIEETLEDRDVNEVINVRELLSDIQDELGSSYFDSLLHDNEDSADMDHSGTTQE